MKMNPKSFFLLSESVVFETNQHAHKNLSQSVLFYGPRVYNTIHATLMILIVLLTVHFLKPDLE